MGNTEQSAGFISQVIVNENMNPDYRGQALEGAILYPDISIEGENNSLLSIVIAAARSIEMFCLVTGEKRKARYVPPSGVYLVSAVHSPLSVLGNILIAAHSNGTIKIFATYSLIQISEISTESEITCILVPTPDLFYVGFADSSIRVWHVSCPDVQHTWEGTGAGVKSMGYSDKHKRLIVGFEGDGENPLHVYETNARDVEQQYSKLEGIEGTCYSICVMDKRSFVVGLSAGANKIVLWDCLTLATLMNFEIPHLRDKIELGTKLGVIQLLGELDVLIIGLTGGSTLLSYLTFNESDLTLTWNPQKSIDLKSAVDRHVSFVKYEVKLDLLVVGHSDSTVSLISNFLTNALGIQNPKILT